MSEKQKFTPQDIRPKNDEQSDISAATLRLLGIGLRNHDRATLDGVKAKLQVTYGEEVGGRVYDEFEFRAILGLNIANIRRNYPEIQADWLDRLETQSIKV